MLALAIFVATLVLVIWQPKGLGIGWSALGGAAVAMLAGVVGWADLGTVWGLSLIHICAAPSAQPFVTYNCIVYPDPVTKVWSGKLILTGLSVGTTAADYRVCRYSADYNGNGSMFSADFKRLENEEHPEVYGRVSTSLTRQNFLVIRGDTSCPTAPAIDFSASVFADYSTLQLQP